MTDLFNAQDLNELREQTETAAGLSDKQFEQSMDYAKILHREIRAEGQFKSKLEGMARELSLDAHFDSYVAARIIRDQYELRYGETPKEHLQRLRDKAEQLTEEDKKKAYDLSLKVSRTMEQQEDPNFFRAYDRTANQFAHSLGITEKKARSLMVQAYKERHENNYFNDYGKVEEKRIRASRGLPEKSQKMKKKAELNM